MSYDDAIKARIKARKARHNQTVRDSILKAARQIAIEDGWRKVSIRAIAKGISYSAPVIYQHFPAGKMELLRTLQSDGFATLRSYIEKAQLSASQFELQLVNISLSYWRFAQDFPELYQVMFNLEGVFVDSQTTTVELRRASQPVIGIFKSLAPKADQEEVFYHWWSTVHGYISLMMSQQLAAYDKDKREQYLRKAITRVVIGLKEE
ncbi:MAG: TetR/AcrR family transcriptional regulator [Bacteroidia bacterium]